jgi:hypothetical protein
VITEAIRTRKQGDQLVIGLDWERDKVPIRVTNPQ